MLGMTLGAANSGEAPLEPAAIQKLLYGTNHNRPQRTRARLEAFFVTTDEAVEVVFKELIKRRSFGMPGSVLRWRIGISEPPRERSSGKPGPRANLLNHGGLLQHGESSPLPMRR